MVSFKFAITLKLTNTRINASLGEAFQYSDPFRAKQKILIKAIAVNNQTYCTHFFFVKMISSKNVIKYKLKEKLIIL